MASVAMKQYTKEIKIDLTPMIDIVFQLIIFFMVVTEMASKDLEDVTLPRANHAIADEDPPSDRMVINIRKDGELWYKGTKKTGPTSKPSTTTCRRSSVPVRGVGSSSSISQLPRKCDSRLIETRFESRISGGAE